MNRPCNNTNKSNNMDVSPFDSQNSLKLTFDRPNFKEKDKAKIQNAENIDNKQRQKIKLQTKPQPILKSPKQKKKKEKYFGYTLRPLIEANGNSKGNIFICMYTRKKTSDLTKYQYIKCWVSLKKKLKKKAKKKQFYFFVLIDLINKGVVEREIARY
eukprot:499696_1